MDNALFDLVDQVCPNFNPRIVEGYAYQEMKKNPEYIDSLFRQVARNFPPELKYLGPRVITPREEFNIVSRFKRNTKRAYSLAINTANMRVYRFSLNGRESKKLEIPLYHLYCERGGIATVHNSRYGIAPVIADIALSVREDSIFILMNRAKLTFRKLTTIVKVDDYNKAIHLVWSRVYNVKRERATKSTLGHYLIAKFGIVGAFKRNGADVQIVERQHANWDNYDREKYVIVNSAGMRLNAMRRAQNALSVSLIIPRESWETNPIVQTIAGSFFYVADAFPERIRSANCDSVELWRLLLGKMILQPGDTDGKILNQIDTHITSVDGYVDDMVQHWLSVAGYDNISDIYKLFELIISEFPRLTAATSEEVASMYGKRLVVNRYVNEDIVNGISKMHFAIQKHINSGKILTETDFSKIATQFLKYNLALKVNYDHSEIKSISSATDCLLHKVTTVTLQQTDTTKGKGKNNGPTWDESKRLHMSIAETNAIMNLPDADPSGRGRLNPHVMTDENGTLLRNPELVEIIDKAQAFINHHQ